MWMMYKPADVDTDLAPGSDLSRIAGNAIPQKNRHHIGRLDRDTSGVLLFTDDGNITHKILSSDNLQKTYLARVSKQPSTASLVALVNGLSLGDGPAIAISALEVDQSSPDIRPLFLCPNKQTVEKLNYFVRVTTCEGRNRIVRRMLAAVNLPVLALHRERIGPLILDPHATPGSVVRLSESEIEKLLLAIHSRYYLTWSRWSYTAG